MERDGSGWRLAVVLGVTLLAAACGEKESELDDEGGPTAPTAAVVPAPAPSPAATPTPAPGQPQPAPTPAPTVSVAYVPDVKPILDQDCVRCHGSLASYQGVLAFVRPGDASSALVLATQPGGSMYGHLSGDRAARSDLIRRWVVENAAAPSR